MAIVVAFKIVSVLDLKDPTGMVPRRLDFFGENASLVGISAEMTKKLRLAKGRYVVVPEDRKVFTLTEHQFNKRYQYHAPGSPWHGIVGDEYHSKEKK